MQFRGANSAVTAIAVATLCAAGVRWLLPQRTRTASGSAVDVGAPTSGPAVVASPVELQAYMARSLGERRRTHSSRKYAERKQQWLDRFDATLPYMTQTHELTDWQRMAVRSVVLEYWDERVEIEVSIEMNEVPPAERNAREAAAKERLRGDLWRVLDETAAAAFAEDLIW